MKLMCSNFKDKKCNIRGNRIPTGMHRKTRVCRISQGIKDSDWILKGNEDCDNLDLEGR